MSLLDKLCPDPNKFVSSSGNRYKILYVGDVQHDGSIELVETGKDDLVALHNAARDDCDINVIVARFCAGDVSVLSRRQGFFGDFSDMPENLAEFMNAGVQSQSAYNNLPDDIKEKFPDFKSWLDSLSNGEFLDVLKNRNLDVQPEDKEEEVTE